MDRELCNVYSKFFCFFLRTELPIYFQDNFCFNKAILLFINRERCIIKKKELSEKDKATKEDMKDKRRQIDSESRIMKKKCSKNCPSKEEMKYKCRKSVTEERRECHNWQE